MQRSLCRQFPAPRLRFVCAALAPLVIAGASPRNAALAQAASGATPTRAELVSVENDVLELVSGAPLTADERQQAAEAVDIGMRSDPKAVLRDYALGRKLLQQTDKDSARLVIVDWNESSDRFEQQVRTQSFRQKLRYAVEAAPPTPGLERQADIENAIVRRHDPVVVLDRARQHIISEINLRFLEDASAWYAQKAGLPGPSGDFKDHLRVWLKDNYASSAPDMAAALCDEPQNFLYLTDALKDPRHNEAAMPALRTKLQGQDASTRDVSLALAVSDASQIANAAVQRALGQLMETAAQASGAIGYGTVVQQMQGALGHH